MKALFRDRRHAGRALAAKLLIETEIASPPVVLALPRGSMQVGFEVARAFRAPLDVCLVRRLEVPRREGVVMGAVASESVIVLLQSVIDEFKVTEQELTKEVRKQVKELGRHERAYRGDLESVPLQNKNVILADDGLTDAPTLKTAIAAIRLRGPGRLVLAAPTLNVHSYRELEPLAEELICSEMPGEAQLAAPWYADLPEVSDLEVRKLHAEARGLAQSWRFLN